MGSKEGDKDLGFFTPVSIVTQFVRAKCCETVDEFLPKKGYLVHSRCWEIQDGHACTMTTKR